MSQIYLNINNKQSGPYDIEAVNKLLLSNQVNLATLAWMQGMANWEALTSESFKSLGVGVPTTVSAKTIEEQRANENQSVTDGQINSLTQHGISATSGTFKIGQAIGEAFAFYKSNIIGSIAWLILAMIIGAIPLANLIVPLMGVNFYTCVHKFQNSGQKMALGDLFDFSNALDKIIGPIVVGVLIGIGYICLIVPGIILTFMWAFTPCIQGDRSDSSFIQAMKESRQLAKGNYIRIFLLVIILAILAFSGFLLLGIGALVTLPVAHVALYCAYAQCKK